MNIETRPAYLYDNKKRTIRLANVNALGNEVIGHTSIVDDSSDCLVLYGANEPIFSPNDGGNSLNEPSGQTVRIEGLGGWELVTEYDVTNPAKYPLTPSALSSEHSLVSNN